MADLSLRHGYLHLDTGDIEDGDYCLRWHGCLASIDELLANDTTHGGCQTAIGQILLSHFELRLGLLHLTLDLHPFHFGQ